MDPRQVIPDPVFERVERFAGLVTSVDPVNVPPGHASNALNASTETGTIKARRGWRNTNTALASFQACYGWDYAQGYDDSSVFKETYLGILKSGGNTRPYEVPPAGGAPSEILDGAAHLALTAGEWWTVALSGRSYSFRAGGVEGVFKHQIGDLTSWTALDAARASDPATGPAVAWELTDDLSTGTAGGAMSWAAYGGANPTVAIGTVTFNAVSGTGVKMNFSAGATSPAAQFDFTTQFPADKDFSTASYIDFTISDTAWKDSSHNYNQAMRLVYAALVDALQYLDVYLINSVALSLKMTVSSSLSYNSSTGAETCTVRLTFPAGYNPLDWTATRKIRLAFKTNTPGYAGVPSWVATISQLTPNTVSSTPPVTPAGTTYRFRFGVEYYDSVRDVNSANVKEGDWYQIEPTKRFWNDAKNTLLGNKATLTATASPDSWVDKVGYYIQFEDSGGVWQFIGYADDASSSYVVDLQYLTLRALAERQDKPANPVGAPTCACSYGGFMVWGYATGRTNIRCSGLGNPGRLYRSATDRSTDALRGGDYTLADNFSDAPKWMGRAGDSLVILGTQGAYVMEGQYAFDMSPAKRVSGSIGILGRAACIWRSSNGLPAAVWLGTDQELWMVELVGYGGPTQYPVTMLTRDVQGEVRQFLTQTDNPDTTQLWLGVDERNDTLRLHYGTRALALRRKALLDNTRPWEPYTYAGTGWLRVAFCKEWGVRGIRTTGQADEFERNSSSNFAEILGTNRDGGSPMPAGFWTGPLGRGQLRRYFAITVHRSDKTKTVDITVTSDRAARTYTVTAGAIRKRCAIDQKGHDHKVSVAITETGPDIQAIWAEVWEASRRPIA